MDTIIFDVDGTLADTTHRLHLVTDHTVSKNWERFFAEIPNDKPHRDVCLLAELLVRTYHESQNRPTYVIKEILKANDDEE